MRFIYAQDENDPFSVCAINADKVVSFFTTKSGKEWQLKAQTTQDEDIILCRSERDPDIIVSLLKEIINELNQPFLAGNINVNKKIEAMSE